MKKRVIALLMASALVTSMLAGCGQAESGKDVESSAEGNGSVAESEVKTSSSTEEEVAELEEMTIQMWTWGGQTEDLGKVNEAFNELLQEYVPNTTVELTLVPSAEYKEKYNQMLASAEPVDLVWVASWVTGNFTTAIADGQWYPMADLLENYGQDIVARLGSDVIDMSRNFAKDNEVYYIISWQGLCSHTKAFAVPTELAKLAGDTWLEDTQDAIDTWWNEDAVSTPEDYQKVYDQLGKYYAACTANDQIYSGPSWEICGYNFATLLESPISGVGILRNDENFTVVDAISSEHYKVMVKNQAEFYQKGYIRSDIATAEGLHFDKIEGAFDNNSQIIIEVSAIGNKEDVEEKLSSTYGMEVSVLPVDNYSAYEAGHGTAYAIPYCSDAPERAMMVYNAIYSVPELYKLLVYGIEGEHYTMNADGTATFPETKTYGLTNWTIGDCLNALQTDVTQLDYYEKMMEFEKTAKVQPFNEFVFDSSPVADISAALTAIQEEYEMQLIYGYTGEKWEETLQKFIDERKAAGLDEFIAEYQKQLDAYIEAKNITSW